MSNVESPYIDKPSLPLVKFGINRYGRITPYCEKHGAMLRFKHSIYRCDACKTSIDMKSFYDKIRKLFSLVNQK